MPPSDQEPRYRLVDSNGNVVGALWGDGNGNVKIADETDTQTTFGADGISTPALEAGSADTDKQFNDEEPNLDISEFWHPAFSQGLRYKTTFISIDNFTQSVSGSGTINQNADRIDLRTGTTSGSSAKLQWNIQGQLAALNKDSRFAAIVRTEDTNGVLGVFRGDVSEDDYSANHYGFKYTGGELKGSVADGTTENTGTVLATPTTGSYIQVYAEFVAGSEVRFWAEKDPLTNNPDLTLSANIPKASLDNFLMTAIAENNSATARTFRAVQYEYNQQP